MTRKKQRQFNAALIIATVALGCITSSTRADAPPLRGLNEVNHSKVELRGGFWGPRAGPGAPGSGSPGPGGFVGGPGGFVGGPNGPGGGGPGGRANVPASSSAALDLASSRNTPSSYTAKISYRELAANSYPVLVPRMPKPYKTFSETFSYADPDEYANALAEIGAK